MIKYTITITSPNTYDVINYGVYEILLGKGQYEIYLN